MYRKVVLDLPLNERGGYVKFGCTGSYRAQMHKEQTNFLVDIYIDRLSSLLCQEKTIDAIFCRNCVETKIDETILRITFLSIDSRSILNIETCKQNPL